MFQLLVASLCLWHDVTLWNLLWILYVTLHSSIFCCLCNCGVLCAAFGRNKKVMIAHTRSPSVGFLSWSRFLAVSLQVTWVINSAVGCHYDPPGLQLPPQPLRGLLPILLLGEQRQNRCEQFAKDCYPTASRLRFEPRPFCAWVQHANHTATEPPNLRC